MSIFRHQIMAQDTDDGNPLIYALKGKFGYTMPYCDFRLLVRAANQILPNALGSVNFDLVVPLPSSPPVAAILALRAARHLPAVRRLPPAAHREAGAVARLQQRARQHGPHYAKQFLQKVR